MKTTKTLENYPLKTVFITNLHSYTVYAIGFYILYKAGWLFSVIYLALVFILELRVLKYHCVDCYYWGKMCGFGKGRLSALLFRKGDNAWFCSKKMTWIDMIPDMMIFLIPFVAGLILLFISFSFLLLALLVMLLVLSTVANGYVRGKLTCNYCRQRELGCPADILFNKKNPTDKAETF